MAKNVTRKTVARRNRKNIEKGEAHIHSSFNNTILQLQILKEMLFRGEVLENLDLKVLEKAHHLLQVKLQKQQLKHYGTWIKNSRSIC